MDSLVDVKDMDAMRQDIKNDYIIRHKLAKVAGSVALRCGEWLALADLVVIAAKHGSFDRGIIPTLLSRQKQEPDQEPAQELPQELSEKLSQELPQEFLQEVEELLEQETLVALPVYPRWRTLLLPRSRTQGE